MPLVFLLAACAADRQGGISPASVRDSAGIRIVEYQGLPPDAPVWSVSDEPLLVLGTADGDTAETFFRITPTRLTTDGRLLIPSAGDNSIRVFDSSGDHLISVGRSGQGPGEFTLLNRAFPFRGDSIAGEDGLTRAIHVFGPGGVYARSFTLAAPGGDFDARQLLAGTLAQGGMVGWTGLSSAAVPLSEGYQRRPVLVSLYDADGARVAVLDTLPGGESRVQLREGGGFQSASLPMGRSFVIAVGRASIVLGTTDDLELRRFDSDGRLNTILRVGGTTPAADEAVRTRYIEHETAAIGDPERRRRREQALRETQFPERLPALDHVLVDAEDRIWVREFVPPYDERQPAWWVFDDGGSLLARATLPVGVVPDDIGTDRILARVRDDLDVQYVHLYGLSQGS